MTNGMRTQLKSLFALTLLLLALSATGAHADNNNDRDPLVGWFLGVNAGSGETYTSWEEGKRSTTEEGEYGAMGAFRVGYAINSKWAISLEGIGMGVPNYGETDEDLGVGAGLVVGTWHPVGHGFFVRMGLGAGGGQFIHPDTREKVELEGKFAALFGLGYDWRIGEKTALGVAFDGFGMEAGGLTGYSEDAVGAGTFSIQFTLHP